MNIQLSAIGEKLKQIRTERNLSLSDVSEITGVSKPMLGQIERSQSIPTITTLWKIATGLKVPLSSFLEEQHSEYTIFDIDKDNVISEDDDRMRAYPICPYDPIRSVEIFYIEFDMNCTHTSEKHNEGVEEYLMVLSGELQLILNGQEITIHQNQGVRFQADITHTYQNISDKACTVYNIIFYPNTLRRKEHV